MPYNVSINITFFKIIIIRFKEYKIIVNWMLLCWIWSCHATRKNHIYRYESLVFVKGWTYNYRLKKRIRFGSHTGSIMNHHLFPFGLVEKIIWMVKPMRINKKQIKAGKNRKWFIFFNFLNAFFMILGYWVSLKIIFFN